LESIIIDERIILKQILKINWTFYVFFFFLGKNYRLLRVRNDPEHFSGFLTCLVTNYF